MRIIFTWVLKNQNSNKVHSWNPNIRLFVYNITERHVPTFSIDQKPLIELFQTDNEITFIILRDTNVSNRLCN